MKMSGKLGRRSVLKGGAVVALAGAAPLAALQSAWAAAPIPVGGVVPITGGGSPYGGHMLKALELTVADVNEAGGPLGRKIILHAADGQTKPDAAVAAVQKLISINHVVAVLGTWSSAVTLAVIPNTYQAGIIEMNTSGATAVTGPKYRSLVFRTYPTDKPFAITMARYAKQKGYRKVSIMAINNPYALTTREWFEKEWKKLGMSPPKSLVYNPGATSYSAEVSQALRDRPDLLLIIGYTPDASIITKEWYAENVPTHVMGTGFALGDAFVKNVGASVCEGFLVVGGLPAIGTLGFKAFAPKFQKATGAPLAESFFAALVHDQMNLLALAIESAKTTAGKDVASHIIDVANPPGTSVHDFVTGAQLLRQGKKINYEGASGPCDFDPEHNLAVNFSVWEIHAGKRKQVATFSAEELESSAKELESSAG